MAQKHAYPSGMARRPQQGHLSSGPIPTPEESPRSEEGCCRCGGIHSYGRLHILKEDGVVYLDLGGDYFDRRDKKRAAQRLVKRLQNLGYTVTLEEAA